MANTWSANEKQKQFMDILAKEENGITLRDIKTKYGVNFATGTINTLVSKGFVNTMGEKEYICECCGHKTKVKVYKLA